MLFAENEYSLASAQTMLRTKSVYAIEHPIRSAFLEAPPGSGEGRQIVFLGNIHERKGIWEAIEAFRQGVPQDWKLAIIGSGEAKAKARLKTLMAQESPVRIRHYPQLNPAEIISVMQASSVFLLPTKIDTGPTALKEAMAMGLWPVCYDNSGPGHYIRKFKFGSLAEDLNPASLLETLRRTIANEAWKSPDHRALIPAQIRPHFNRLRIWRELVIAYKTISEA